MSAERTERLLNLLTLLLNARKPMTLRAIRELDEFAAYRSDEPKTGERAFERDKAALIDFGVPIRWIPPEDGDDEDSYGGYVIDRDRYYLPQLQLEPSELALLSIAGAAAAAIEAFPGRHAVIRALAKLGFDSDDARLHSAPYLAHAPANPGSDATRLGAHLEVLHKAVARRERVRLSYRSAPGELSDRVVDPYGMYYRSGAWYLVGLCHLRHTERTFHVGRIESVTGAGAAAAFDLPPSFDLSAHVQRRPWELPQDPPITVVIRIASRLVPAIPELFGRRAVVRKDSDGAIVMLSVTHQAALVAAVLPQGTPPRCSSLRPCVSASPALTMSCRDFMLRQRQKSGRASTPEPEQALSARAAKHRAPSRSAGARKPEKLQMGQRSAAAVRVSLLTPPPPLLPPLPSQAP